MWNLRLRHRRMRLRPLLMALCAASGMLSVVPAHAGKVAPPLELLYSPDTLLVAGSLVDINPAGRLVFRRKTVLAGKGRIPELVDLRVASTLLDTVKLNESYVFGYSMVTRDPRQRGAETLNPDGGVLLTSIGLEPALFRDTPQARAILKAGRSEHGRESRGLLDLLLKALRGNDPSLQTLAAGELALDRELAERLRADDRPLLESAARNSALPAAARASLLQSSAADPSAFGPWWQTVAMDLVANAPVGNPRAGAAADDPLILAALELLERQSVRVPAESLRRWASSPTATLAERALLALRRESPAAERTAIEQALADPQLPQQTRAFLVEHRRRLDRAETRARARNGNAG